MQNLIKIAALLLILPLCCFGSSAANSTQKTIVYVIEESTSAPNTLTIHVDLDRTEQYSKTQLILRGVSMGIAEQVKNMTCDDKSIKENKPGAWSIPNGCQKLQWQVPLLEGGTELAGAQQSMKSGDFMLFSEASSLARLQNTNTSEILKISIPNVKKIFPSANLRGEITLPSANSAPFFVVVNPTVVGSDSSGSINLTYFLDNSVAVSKLPSMSSHMKGLRWLHSIIPGDTKQKFSVAWLGISEKQGGLAGAAGNGILLANYPLEGEFPFGKAMLLYVGLHEGFHQFAMNYPTQPTWISESLASYYGIRALEVSLPNDPATSALKERFLAGANQFHNGLLTINQHVKEGDRSEYGAFYTKGIAFWIAVDKELKQRQEDGLDNYLIYLLRSKYDDPIELQRILKLSPETWVSLCHRFLES